jgi:hypothetical protein
LWRAAPIGWLSPDHRDHMLPDVVVVVVVVVVGGA